MNFIMHRDIVVPTLLGRSFEFKKGEPLHVPQNCWPAVQAAGAVPEDELPDDSKNEPSAPQGEEREKAIVDAINAMVLKAQRDDFTASGAPSAPVVSGIVGFAVDNKERDDIWAKVQNDGTGQ